MPLWICKKLKKREKKDTNNIENNKKKKKTIFQVYKNKRGVIKSK